MYSFFWISVLGIWTMFMPLTDIKLKNTDWLYYAILNKNRWSDIVSFNAKSTNNKMNPEEYRKQIKSIENILKNANLWPFSDVAADMLKTFQLTLENWYRWDVSWIGALNNNFYQLNRYFYNYDYKKIIKWYYLIWNIDKKLKALRYINTHENNIKKIFSAYSTWTDVWKEILASDDKLKVSITKDITELTKILNSDIELKKLYSNDNLLVKWIKQLYNEWDNSIKRKIETTSLPFIMNYAFYWWNSDKVIQTGLYKWYGNIFWKKLYDSLLFEWIWDFDDYSSKNSLFNEILTWNDDKEIILNKEYLRKELKKCEKNNCVISNVFNKLAYIYNPYNKDTFWRIKFFMIDSNMYLINREKINTFKKDDIKAKINKLFMKNSAKDAIWQKLSKILFDWKVIWKNIPNNKNLNWQLNYIEYNKNFYELFNKLNKIYIAKWYIWWNYKILNFWNFKSTLFSENFLTVNNPFIWKDVAINIEKSNDNTEKFIDYYLDSLNWLIISDKNLKNQWNFFQKNLVTLKVNISNELLKEAQNNIANDWIVQQIKNYINKNWWIFIYYQLPVNIEDNLFMNKAIYSNYDTLSSNIFINKQ